MSNQVYSNNTDKYVSQNGINLLQLINTGITSAQNYVKLQWANQIIQTPNLFEILTNGDIKILKNGVYSLQVSLSGEDAVNPSTNPIQCKLLCEVIKPSTGPTTLSTAELCTFNTSLITGATNIHNTVLNVNIFLNINDIVNFQARAFNTTGLNFGYTNCLITMI